jgi:radical SAM superfamily enzyme YgiQ (UPF0313 family)
MELPCRNAGDILIKPGELRDIRQRLLASGKGSDITSVIACAFDHRTRMLPFIGPDLRMAPAGPRAIGSSLVESGFEKTRIVLQQWNRNFRPSAMKLDGRVPDIFMVSAMSLHTACARDLIRDTLRIDAERRPLIIAGGSVCVYEPWQLWSNDPSDPYGPDIAVTGEEYVLLSLMERIMDARRGDEPLRQTLLRLRGEGLLNDIPGLIYPVGDGPVPDHLVDTGIQRLCGDLDQQAHPIHGYGLLEAPSKSTGLASKPLDKTLVKKKAPLGSIVMTLGCKFGCPYCPIPAYNQRQYRMKSGERIADEISRLYTTYGLRVHFGADDNFFNDAERTLSLCETLRETMIDGKPLRRRARIATEVTVHDTLKLADHMEDIRKAGVRALWLGVEDMSGNLVKKGQTADSTARAFKILRDNGIMPNPMLMHHDDQKLYTTGDQSGLLNQVNLLRKAGAVTVQVLMITPSRGSRLYEETYESGMVIKSAGGRNVAENMYDGNYVIASKEKRPWRKQLNLLLAYLFFYNVVRVTRHLIKLRRNKHLAWDAGAQFWGMWGLAYNIRRTLPWAVRLLLGKIRRHHKAPPTHLPLKSPDGDLASHDQSAHHELLQKQKARKHKEQQTAAAQA